MRFIGGGLEVDIVSGFNGVSPAPTDEGNEIALIAKIPPVIWLFFYYAN